MADAKITALTAMTTAATGDILAIVDDPTGTPLTQKITVANLAASIALDTLGATTDITTRNASASAHGLLPKLSNTSYSFLDGTGAWNTNLADGWISRGDTWTYASASTFTIAGDVTAQFTTGIKLKLTQTTVKYFYVVSSAYGAPNTTVTITGGSDYTLANAAITNNYISRDATPTGFPHWFAYAPTFGGFSADPTGAYRFSVNGRVCTLMVRNAANGTSNANTYTMTAPITAATVTDASWSALGAFVVDNNTTQSAPARATVDTGSATINIFKTIDGGTWTTSNGKRANFTLIYEV